MAEILVSSDVTSKIIKRAKTIMPEIFDLEPADVKNRSILYLAKQAKEIASEYGCIIKSWIESDQGYAECYNIKTYDGFDNNSYAEIIADDEEKAILIAFMWLADRQNFTPESIKIIREEMM